MERIYVTVRARPLSLEDAKSSPWRISGNAISHQISSSYKFEFDRIFEERCKTRDVYEARTKEIVAAAVQGFNGTVFAYGQTNSGKTHTMRGTGDEPGIIPLAVNELFNVIQEASDREFLLRMSYMEIYNEEINDLLAPGHRRLQIHESVERGVFVAGLSEEIVASPEQVLELMEHGESNRHIGETNMNLHSSRSHTIFRMVIESRERPEEGELESHCDAVRVSILNLVDLAGSERAAKTGAEGVRLKEGSHINKSLMTLGTVIKKLSEGAESQGGHVPYRDSKLTRILQPALGGNANTAIICNITLAPIHADETKSSLQFASRALRVTNCAHVNEILTDAALLKRQKKEIEQLRAKLQGSHSEHLEEEVLNLRNTLLQTELEKERIALELEEEKRSQAERDKRLEEQAERIKNLSSMVLNANIRERHKKIKRRDTWCPGKLSDGKSINAPTDSVVENVRPEREVGPLFQFEELVDESEAAVDLSSKPDNILPDVCSLSKVTSRRKVPVKKKTVPPGGHELIELREEYEDLQMQFEAQRIMFEVEVDCLKGIIVEGSMNFPELSTNSAGISNEFCDRSKYLKDPGTAHVITGLQDQIKELEREKYLIQQNLGNAVKIAKELNLCTLQENEEDINSDLISKLLPEIAQISEEVQSLRTLVETSSSIIDDLFLSHASSLSLFSELRAAMCQYLMQLKETSNSYETQKCYLESKIKELQEAKLVWENKSADFCKQVDDLTTNIQESEKALADLSEEHNLEKSRLVDGIIVLEKEVSSLSTSTLSREKELLRKDLEKTRAKLKDSESKLKNVIQEKTRLEGEKANAEREIKKLSNQKAFLERDKSRRESVAVRRRDSVVDKRSRCDDDNVLQTLEECQKLEVVAFEMERTIASLEDELAFVRQEKDDVATRNESLSFELEVLSEKLTKSESELGALREEILGLRSELENSEASHQTLASKISQITEEKEELAMQMTHAFLELEEERAIWSTKEKASTASIQENMNKYNDKIISLSTQLSKVTNEMLSLGEEFKLLEQRLKDAEERADLEKNHGLEKLQEINQLKHDFDVFQQESNKSELLLKEKAEELQSDLSRALDEVGSHQIKLLAVTKERDELQFRIMQNEKSSNLSNDSQGLRSKQEEEPCCSKADDESQQKKGSDDLAKAKLEEGALTKRRLYLEAQMHKERAMYNMEKAKLRMRLRGTQTKLDAFRVRYKEAIDEQVIMDRSFKEASAKLKNRLASSAIEVLNLKKELASARAPY